MNRFFTKSKNPIFGHFWAQIGPKDFLFENRAPLHFGHTSPFCTFVPKFRKKQMSRSREKLVTDKRTNERTNERTDTGQFKGPPEVGPKTDSFVLLVKSHLTPVRFRRNVNKIIILRI